MDLAPRKAFSGDLRSGGDGGFQSGFGNELESEAVAGALPIGQNSPQQAPFGLFSELVSGTAFSAPRAFNRRTYLFRVLPSAMHGPFKPVGHETFLTPPLEIPANPNQMRWDPWTMPETRQDFLDGISTLCGNGTPSEQGGMCIHVYRANKSMERRFFLNADGEMLLVPELGRILVATELGTMEVRPTEIAVVPRGIKFRVDPLDGEARGFICENFGLPFRLPELGLIGSNGLANSADFKVPNAAYEVDEQPYVLVQKFCGTFWQAELSHSPLDVVAWRGNYLPYKYDMKRFVALGTATVDHPDPSIFCALTSPSSDVQGGNADFLILPPRWLVAEHSFRPPGFHRNCVAEFLAIIVGRHDSKAKGFQPGGASLHNHWAAHGPDVETHEMARVADLAPRKIEESVVFMIETRLPLQLSRFAVEGPQLQQDYQDSWQNMRARFPDLGNS